MIFIKIKTTHKRINKIRKSLLLWYDINKRQLPWRLEPISPYAVWLSEVMLQQTTVATVGPYFGNFMARWPNVKALAGAPLDDVLHAWQGLGYYARARNLHKCATAVAGRPAGKFPDTEAGLLELPGIGPYTAAAIAAIAFDQPAMPVDGNIERVTARLFGITTPLPKSKPEIAAAARIFAATERPGDFAQAMMDLGAGVCTPTRPDCGACPIRENCLAQALGCADRLPARAARRARPTRRAVAYWLTDKDDRVMLRRRPESGLLGGMMEFPSTAWQEGDWPSPAMVKAARPGNAKWSEIAGEVVHVFTHFRLEIRIQRGVLSGRRPRGAIFAELERLSDHALPTVMKKIVQHVMAGQEPDRLRRRQRPA